MSATSRRRAGYGALATIAFGLVLPLSLAAPARASSVAVQTVPFGRAVTMSARVVKGTVKGRSAVKIDGGTFHALEIVVDAVLKGPPAKAGERVQVFNPAEWFQHTHAAAIKGGVVSYADPHYATPVPDAQLKPGAVVMVFLRGEAPPPGFPPNAAFLSCGEAFERPARAGDVARMKTAAFGDPITLKVGEVAVLPDGFELELNGHSHSRPVTGGPLTDTAELEARSGTHAKRMFLDHVFEAGKPSKETWQTRTWRPYRVQLLGMTTGGEKTLRVVRVKTITEELD